MKSELGSVRSTFLGRIITQGGNINLEFSQSNRDSVKAYPGVSILRLPHEDLLVGDWKQNSEPSTDDEQEFGPRNAKELTPMLSSTLTMS
jgi:hypothetical protein